MKAIQPLVFRIFRKFCVLFFVLLASCAQLKGPEKSFDLKGEFNQGQSALDYGFLSQSPYRWIVVLGLNDFHGSLSHRIEKSPDGQVYPRGGGKILAKHVKLLKERFQDQLLVVDAGDEWQGTLESNKESGKSVVRFFNQLGVQVAAVGNHEFDFGLPAMTKNFSHAKYPYVASNIIEKKTQKPPVWPNFYPYTIINSGGVRVAVIGVSTIHTPSTTRYENVKHLEFQDGVKRVTELSKTLRDQGVSIVLITTHSGTLCVDDPKLREYRIWAKNEIPENVCDEREELGSFLERLPVGTVDGVVSGHTHQAIRHWMNSVPVIQGEAYAQYYNLLFLPVDPKTGKVVSDLARIEGLVPICEVVYEGLGHCDPKRLKKGENPKLVPWVWNGKTLPKVDEFSPFFRDLEKKVKKYKQRIVGYAKQPLLHDRGKESLYNNLVADAVRSVSGADIALLNGGGLRQSLEAGPISEASIFSALPFDNLVKVVEMSGRQVEHFVKALTSGALRVPGVSGLKVTLNMNQATVKHVDLNADGKKDVFEFDRVLGITDELGNSLDPDRRYRVATVDFLIEGGDDLFWFMSQIDRKQIEARDRGSVRDAFSKYVRKRKVVGTEGDVRMLQHRVTLKLPPQ